MAGIQLGNAGTIAFAIVIQHDDKIVMTGTTADTLDGVSDSDVFVARFLKDGQIDSTFGQNGAVRFFHQGWDEKGWAIAEQHQGRIIVGGSQLINTASASAIFMLDSLGNPVPTFGVNGMYLDINTFSAHTIIVRPNGDFMLHVYDSSAWRVRTLQWTETITGVETTHPLDLLDLADGYYVLQVLLQEKQYLFPVIKAN